MHKEVPNGILPYRWLDLIRGLAAVAVFTGHLRVLCIEDTPWDGLSRIGQAIFFFTGFSHIAVVLFFVLSGFLIIKSIDESAHRGDFKVKNYAVNRLSRLWVVLIPSLLISFLLDTAGLHYFGDSLFYSGQYKYFLDADLHHRLSAIPFLGNLFFLQTIKVPTFGSNGALWSLANEFWYYVVFPLFYFGITLKNRSILRIFLVAAGVLLLFFVGSEIATFFLIWLFGGLSYIFSKEKFNTFFERRWLRYAAVFLFAIFAVMTRSKIYPEVFNNYTVGAAFAVLIPFLIRVNIANLFAIKISDFLSNISYTLYLVHLPFIFFVTALFGFQGQTWNHINLLLLFLFTIGTLLYAWILWYFFERNTTRIKKYFLKR